MTGAEIDKLFDWKTDRDYSAYNDPVKKNRLFKNALYLMARKKYMGLDTEAEYDELRNLTSFETIAIVNRNEIATDQIVIVDIQIGVGPTLNCTTLEEHHLAVGDTITFTGSGGLTVTPAMAANNFTVTAVTATVFRVDVTTAAGVYTNNSEKLLRSNLLPRYLHLFAIKPAFEVALPELTISETGRTSPLTITVNTVNQNLRTGERIKIIGCWRDPAANGTWYINKINSRKFELYSDASLRIPAPPGTGTQQPSGSIYRFYSKYAKPIASDRKTDTLDYPTVSDPGYQVGDGCIRIFPLTENCTGAVVDYLKNPRTFIDVNDDVLDLETIYPQNFLYLIIDQAAKMYSGPSHDQYLNKSMVEEIIENP